MSEGGRLAAVTGASRGIGRATALALAGRGYRVFALARSESDLHALATDGRQRGGEIVPVVMDIADGASRQAAVTAILEAGSGYGLDVLINNAGYGQLGPLEEVSEDKLRHQLEVNVVGLHAFTLPFLPGMRQRQRGWIVNVSSSAGRVSTPFMGAYSASKFALEAMSDALRLELAPFGVHVILIEPGPIRTSFDEAARAAQEEPPNSPYAPFVARYGAAQAANDLFSGSADKVAGVIVRALEARRPHARYTVTLPAKLGTVGHRLVPDVVMDWVLGRAMRGL